MAPWARRDFGCSDWTRWRPSRTLSNRSATAARVKAQLWSKPSPRIEEFRAQIADSAAATVNVRRLTSLVSGGSTGGLLS